LWLVANRRPDERRESGVRCAKFAVACSASAQLPSLCRDASPRRRARVGSRQTLEFLA
jgi:hypothetical protein